MFYYVAFWMSNIWKTAKCMSQTPFGERRSIARRKFQFTCQFCGTSRFGAIFLVESSVLMIFSPSHRLRCDRKIFIQHKFNKSTYFLWIIGRLKRYSWLESDCDPFRKLSRHANEAWPLVKADIQCSCEKRTWFQCSKSDLNRPLWTAMNEN